MDESWRVLLSPANSGHLSRAIAERIVTRRWFGAKARSIRQVTVMDAVPVTDTVRVVLFEIDFAEGPSEVYQVPLALVRDGEAQRAMERDETRFWGQVGVEGQETDLVLLDAASDPAFSAALLQLFDSAGTWQSDKGQIAVQRAAEYDAIRGPQSVHLPSHLSQAEQSNTSIRYGDRLILKLYRRVETGVNPDWELNAFLAARRFDRIPPLCGAIEYRRGGQTPWTLGLLQGLVASLGDGWEYTLEELREEIQRVTAQGDVTTELPPASGDLLTAAQQPIPHDIHARLTPGLSRAKHLAQRTAEMHLLLASDSSNSAFAPESVTPADLTAWAQGIGASAERTFKQLSKQVADLPADIAPLAQRVLAGKREVDAALDGLVERPIEAMRIRIHGDYHLGQILVTGDDFAILDFEGEPARPLDQRRAKQFALRDTAGMIRSFHYASRAAAASARQRHPSAARRVDQWTHAWYFWTSVAFLAAYRQTAGAAVFLPRTDEQFRRLMAVCLVEKAVYELQYELNHRPDWVYLPLEALAEMLAPS